MTTLNADHLAAATRFLGGRHDARAARAVGLLEHAATWPESIEVPAAVHDTLAQLAAVLKRPLPTTTLPSAEEYLSKRGDELLAAYAATPDTSALRAASDAIAGNVLARLVGDIDAAASTLWQRFDASFADAFAAQLEVDLDAPDRLSAADLTRLSAEGRAEVERAHGAAAVLTAAAKLSTFAVRLPAGASVVEEVSRFVTFDDGYTGWQRFATAQRPGLKLRGPLLAELAKAGAHPTLARTRADLDARVDALDTSRAEHRTSNVTGRQRNLERSAHATARHLATITRPGGDAA